MNIALHVPSSLLWFVGGFIIGVLCTRIWWALYERAAIGRMFGW